MTSHIDHILARALLTPTPPCDVAAAEARLAARLADGSPDRTAPAGGREETADHAPDTDERMARDLRTLCEAIIGRDGALAQLQEVITHRILEPTGARVLGCVLQLAGHEDSAQFWWQFAGGAGDPAAAYCLYLHHMALGEEAQAHWWLAWWHEQAGGGVPPVIDPEKESATTDHEMAIALRVLRGLKKGTVAPAATTAVIEYVAQAVDFIDDLDLPLPEPEFADRIEDLTATETATSSAAPSGKALLPERRPGRPSRPGRALRAVRAASGT
ncbi:hypothetical protein [Streptomyces sparsogenes]|uniref:Uncharacterized protein n=1 Tax=Streptomyces sparsogenes DSM 40356 TaxID=1331668 RepID=A0A1R1S702_9ACTN|nr:hypothetical protein [Streptomyces sparsogenes]OMI34067.1 hypothetical protein SPAR_38310 [Streptomyces sparsogenes DSM 40356]